MKKRLPVACPSCGKTLQVMRLGCPACGTGVEGDFTLSILAKLGEEDQGFLLDFLKCRGSLKDLAKVCGVSYPTVRNRLDALIERVSALEKQSGGETT